MSYKQSGYVIYHPNHDIFENERGVLIIKLEPQIDMGTLPGK